jgi:hypothetical protein
MVLLAGLLAAATIGCSEDEEEQIRRFFTELNASGEIPDAYPASLTANLVGAAEVPAVTTGTTGTATLTPGVNALAYTITLVNAENVTQAHIHDGAAGVNGNVLSTLFSGPTTGDTSGLLVAGTITTLPTGIASWNDYFTKLRDGGAYVNVHTTAHSGGEIRSQTNIVGNASFEINGDVIEYEIEVFNGIGVTGAHIHEGDASVANGPVRVTLYNNAGGSALVNGTLMSGEFEAADITGMTFAELVAAMETGDVYVNVHTLAFAGGAIRGQVEPE